MPVAWNAVNKTIKANPSNTTLISRLSIIVIYVRKIELKKRAADLFKAKKKRKVY